MAVRLRQLEAFRAVSQLGSMTRAAKQLEISQPAVSRLLSSFSASIGFKLFERHKGQLIPTQESRFLLREVSRLLDSLDHIDDLTHSLTARKAGHLRIACLPGFATSHMPRVLAGFLKNRPAVTVTLEPDRPERILEWIIGEQYDCGITDGFSDHPAIDSEDVAMRTVCILPKGHPLGAKSEIAPSDLVDEQFVYARRDSVFFRKLNDVFRAENLTMNYRIETRQFTAACMIVAEGFGVSVVSEMDAMSHRDKGLLIRPFKPMVPHVLSLLRPIHAPASMIALEFLEYFQDSLRPYRMDGA
ncbi:MAG: LysR substrate-binding domain-containing protein [Paracoccaceae bacterium]